MSTFDWPDALVPQSCTMPLRKTGLQFQSPFNGTVQALDFVAERWVLSANLAQMSSRNPRGVGALLNQLAGGVNRVRAWPFHTRGVPRGTLRGTPTLGTAAARGDTTLQLAGGTNRNLVRYGSFELDTNADGLADGWALFVGSGGDGARTYSKGLVTYSYNVRAGTYAQFVAITAAGNAFDSGIVRTSKDPIAPLATYTVSGYLSCTTAGKAYIMARQYKADGTTQTGPDTVTGYAGTSMARLQATFTAQADAAFVELAVRGFNAVGEDIRVDAVQVEAGSAATDYAGPPTLLADDYIGAGGQLFQVAADCTGNDAGAIAVPLVNRVRGTIASAAAVTWHKPTAEFILPAMQAGPVFRPGAIDGTALDLVEVW